LGGVCSALSWLQCPPVIWSASLHNCWDAQLCPLLLLLLLLLPQCCCSSSSPGAAAAALTLGCCRRCSGSHEAGLPTAPPGLLCALARLPRHPRHASAAAVGISSVRFGLDEMLQQVYQFYRNKLEHAQCRGRGRDAPAVVGAHALARITQYNANTVTALRKKPDVP
jgi:hypothetical protein